MRHRFFWKRHFILFFTLVCVLINAFAYALYTRYQDVHQSSNWVIKSYENLRQTRKVFSSAQDMEIGQRGFLLTGSKDFIGPFESAALQVSEEVEQLKRQFKGADRNQQIRLDKLATLIEQQRDLLSVQTNQYRQGPRRYDLIIEDLRHGKVLMDQIRQTVDDIINAELSSRDQHTARERDAEKSFMLTMMIGGVLTIGGLFAANAAIFRQSIRGRQIEERLKSSEERFLLAMQGVNDGLFDYNIQSGTIYYSTRYKEMLGYKDEDFSNTLEVFNEHLHPEDYEKTWDMLQKYFRHETDRFLAFFRMRHRDGSYRWIMCRAKGVWDEKGAITRLVGANTDVSEQKQREEYLAQLNKDLENFTYIASHDLRAPLVNLKGFASEIDMSVKNITAIIKEHKAAFSSSEQKILDEALDTDIPESLQFISSSVSKMDALTTAILDLSRIGRREHKIEEIDVRALVERCLHTLAYDISNRNITVTIGALPAIQADCTALEQVFGNILDNAVKYLQPDRAGIINIEGVRYAHETVFSVRDNGRGIAQHDIHKVFDMFRRAGNSSGIRGSGMGMAYVKATVQRMGGRIWVESKVEEGTIFYFTVPRTIYKEFFHG